MKDPLLAMLLNVEVRAPGRIEQLRSEFGKTANRHVVIDNVLQAKIFDILNDVALQDGNFVDNLKLVSAAKDKRQRQAGTPRGSVDLLTFNGADDADRFIYQRRLDGARPGHEDSRAIKTEALVRRAMGSEGFLSWLSAISGKTLDHAGGINLKLHGPEHFLRKHSDTRLGRKLCMVLYLHQHWHPDYAGRFKLYRDDGRVEFIDPLPNRMLLFDVTQDNFHEIEALGDVPPGWVRINYSAWFG